MPDDENAPDEEASDAALLHSMATDQRGSDRAKAAWATFYNRHKHYLYSVCHRAYSGTLDSGQIEELVHDTFIRAYEKAATYRPSQESEDPADGRRRVRAWLGRVSQNILRDYFRNEPQITFTDEPELAPDPPSDSAADELPPQQLARLEEALAQLSEAEQEVLRVTAIWHRPGERHQRLPNSVMQRLASSLNTRPANVRQIRARALAKLRKILQPT